MKERLGLLGPDAARTPRWEGRIIRQGLLTMETCWRAFDAVAPGDFCEVSPRPDGTTGIIVGDAPGWGAEAARMAGKWSQMAKAELRAGQAPEDVLALLDQEVMSEGPDLLATALCLVVDPDSGIAEVSNAGHLPPLLVGDRKVREVLISADGALGIGGNHRVGSFSIGGDDVLYLVTDGMVERHDLAFSSGWDVLVDAARGLSGTQACASQLARVVTERLGGPDDDAMAVSLRLSGALFGSGTDASVEEV